MFPGTPLTTPRFGYRHIGLYAGGGRVLHYRGGPVPGRRGPVEEVSLAQFARGRGYAVLDTGGAYFDGAAAVARARSRLGEDRYSVWSNNCEHFVSWCLHGHARSPQIDAWRHRAERAHAALRRWLRWPSSFSGNPAT
jgi:hypothetical protein